MTENYFPDIRLRDVVKAMEDRNRHDEAEFYYLLIAIELGLRHGIREEEVLDMKVDRIARMMQLPEVPDGYDYWAWGKAEVVANSD